MGTLVLKGKDICVRMHFDKGLLDYIKIFKEAEEAKNMKEIIELSAFPADMKYDLVLLEHKYQNGTDIFNERCIIEDHMQNILRAFNEKVGVKYQDKILKGTLSSNEAKEYTLEFLNRIDAIHTQNRFHDLFKVIKESLNNASYFSLLP